MIKVIIGYVQSAISTVNQDIIGVYFSIAGNVRRYVLLAPLRGGACFCTRDALQGYDCYLFILALAKTVTPGGSPRREPGQAVAPATKPSSLVTQLSRHGAPMTYTGLLGIVAVLFLFVQNREELT